MRANAIETNGFACVSEAIPAAAVEQIRGEIAFAFERDQVAEKARSSHGYVYAARNLIDLVPMIASCWRTEPLIQILKEVLGKSGGLVRALYFDKPPDRSWSLPWHKDRTIAVEDNSLRSEYFSRPTNKDGVPHVVACDEILQRMLTLRIHLDDVDDDNGPLRVIPQSHFSKDCAGVGPEHGVTIHAKAGDVLAMRPLIDHASGSSKSGITRHRRILHLEFAGIPGLPDGYRWHRYIPIVGAGAK